MMHLLTCRSFNSRKRSGWASDKCLARFDVLSPVVSSFTFIICFVWKIMPYFTSTVLYLLISGALIEFNLFDPSSCSVVRFTGFAAIWEAIFIRNSSVWNTEMSKIMISYRLKYNRYRYSSSTGIPRIPRTQIKIFLMESESSLTLHRQQGYYHDQCTER